ncbi:MAG: hypothetical protein R2827_05400 [Bdellovibrionales bacterium]
MKKSINVILSTIILVCGQIGVANAEGGIEEILVTCGYSCGTGGNGIANAWYYGGNYTPAGEAGEPEGPSPDPRLADDDIHYTSEDLHNFVYTVREMLRDGNLTAEELAELNEVIFFAGTEVDYAYDFALIFSLALESGLITLPTDLFPSESQRQAIAEQLGLGIIPTIADDYVTYVACYHQSEACVGGDRLRY